MHKAVILAGSPLERVPDTYQAMPRIEVAANAVVTGYSLHRSTTFLYAFSILRAGFDKFVLVVACARVV